MSSDAGGGRPLLLRGGRIVDPSQGLDRRGDLLLREGRVEAVLPVGGPAPAEAQVWDVSRFVVAPGFIDLHCHLREPGEEHKETIASGTLAAVRGGFTTVCAMPNTRPPADTRAVIELVLERARLTGACRVLPVGCVTVGQAGTKLADLADLADAGAVAFSDDGRPVADAGLLRHALSLSRALGRVVMEHCEEPTLTRGGVVHEGWVALHLGLPGMPHAAEEVAVSRAVAMAALTGGPLHLCHLSAASSLEHLHRARAQGLAVSAEVTPHHLLLTEERVLGPEPQSGVMAYDTNAKMNPPLRTEGDRQALIQALREGLIEAIATDHAPHAPEDKACEFGVAAFGVVGLETAFGVCMQLVHTGQLDLPTLIERLTWGPARVLGRGEGALGRPPLPRGLGTLQPGAPADVVIVDPDAEWTVDPEAFASRGRNTPFAGWRLRGRVIATIVEGKVQHVLVEEEVAR